MTMGADLLLAAALVEPLDELHLRVDLVSDALLLSVGEDYGCYAIEGVDDAGAALEMRQVLHDAIATLFAGRRRDVAELDLGGQWYWFTGGLSWGDSPTAAWTDFCMLSDAGVLSTNPLVLAVQPLDTGDVTGTMEERTEGGGADG